MYCNLGYNKSIYDTVFVLLKYCPDFLKHYIDMKVILRPLLGQPREGLGPPCRGLYGGGIKIQAHIDDLS